MLFIFLSNRKPLDEKETKEEIKQNPTPMTPIEYSVFNKYSINRYELAVYGYLCLAGKMCFESNDPTPELLVHNNPIMALNYFVKATLHGALCWKEIECILISQQGLSTLFHTQKAFVDRAKIVFANHIGDLEYPHLNLNARSKSLYRDQMSKEALNQIFEQLTILLKTDHSSAYYLNALIVPAQFAECSTTTTLIYQSNSYLRAAALGHPLAIEAFKHNWTKLLKAEMTHLSIPILIPLLRLITGAGSYLFPAMGVSTFLEFYDSLYHKLLSLEVNQNQRNEVNKNFQAFSLIFRCDQIAEAMNLKDSEKLNFVIMQMSQTSNTLALDAFKELIVKMQEALTKKLKALPEKKADTQLVDGSEKDNEIKSTEEASIKGELEKIKLLLNPQEKPKMDISNVIRFNFNSDSNSSSTSSDTSFIFSST